MKKLTKKMKVMHSLINHEKIYNIEECITLLKKMATSKFNESVDISINLNIDPKKPNQNIRNSAILPHGTGKLIKVAVFTQEENINIAKKCGAEYIGLHDLIKKIKTEGINFDVAIASLDVMHIVNQLGPILGPKGLMPNPKLGTATNDIKTTIENVKRGQISYKNDKNGIVHTTIGKINFINKKIKENLHALLTSLYKLKPTNSKKTFIKKITLATTMSLGINIDHNNLN